jgi:hypothetical protein
MTKLGLLVFGALAAVFGTVVGDLVSEEIRRRLDQVPRHLVRVAARRLPPASRAERVEEWCAEIDAILARRGATRLPITRLVIGVRFAAGLFAAVPSMRLPAAASRRRSAAPVVVVAGVAAAAGLIELALTGNAISLLICEGVTVVVALRIALPAVPRSGPATLVVAPHVVLFVVDIVRRLEGGSLPAWCSIAGTTLLLWQPYFVLRFIRLLRPVPVFVRGAAVVICSVTCLLTGLSPRPLTPEILCAGPGLMGVLLLGLGMSTVVAGVRQSSFAARYLLLMTGAATTLLAISAFNIVAGAMTAGGVSYMVASRVTAVVAFGIYLAVVRTPRWIRALSETPRTPIGRG